MYQDPVENGREWIRLKLKLNVSDYGWKFNGQDPDPLEYVKRVNTPTKMEWIVSAMCLLLI